ncbi:MAG: phosphoenolpyruvate--protein phosphotransferase [Desulfobacteraceae bacterium]|jgi:phosphotransferase system enzyme I (PtsP)
MTTEKRDHLNLLCHVGDLANLIAGTADIEKFLQQTVETVACHLNAQVGSIYLFDESTGELVLKATVGLNPAAVGKVRMRPNEGLVGWTFNRMQPIKEGHASQHPQFKYFSEAKEDPFESFLAVPLRRGVERIGVLVVQHERPNYFSEIDVMALRAIASQLVGAIENARLMIDLNGREETGIKNGLLKQLATVKAKRASKGVALSPVVVHRKRLSPLSESQGRLAYVENLEGFLDAIDATMDQLRQLQGRLARRLPESASLIFEAHFMILKDPHFLGAMKKQIKEGQLPVTAVRSVARQYIDRFAVSDNIYVREKTQDIEDLARRLLTNLRKNKPRERKFSEAHIVIAQELFPSDLLKLATEAVSGVVLVSGGVTSHVAIIARSLKIPLVIADNLNLLKVPDDTLMLLDADVGIIYVQPPEPLIEQFKTQDAARKAAQDAKTPMQSETRTKCGHQIHLMANINLLSELTLANELKADGVGLYRTEFPFLIRSAFPSEEEQYLVYHRLCQEMKGRPINIRTLDIGGDKVLPYLNAPAEANPELGLRSLRFSLRYPDIFEQQLRAILRAGVDVVRLNIMFPMVSSLDEFRQAKGMLQSVMDKLLREQHPCNTEARIGMMIELPSLLEIIDHLAREADFFAVGTNDFIQYMLAVDRTNEKVATYYQTGHPAVLRGLHRVAKAALNADIPISVCGEMGHEPDWIPFLIGIGIKTLSVDPQFLPLVQKTIATFSLEQAQAYAASLLKEATLDKVQEKVMQWQKNISPKE